MSDFDQKRFNRFIIENKVIGFFNEPVKLKSGRMSSWYINWRNIAEDVYMLESLAEFVIQFTKSRSLNPDCFYGVPEGATKLGLIAQYKWALQSVEYGPGSHSLPMGRGMPKTHGEPKDRYFLCEPSGKTIIIEDVTTTGDSLLETISHLEKAGADIIAVLTLTNRMEIRDDGLSVEEAVDAKGIPFYSLSNALDLLPGACEALKPGEEVLNALKAEFEMNGVGDISLCGQDCPDDSLDEPAPALIGGEASHQIESDALNDTNLFDKEHHEKIDDKTRNYAMLPARSVIPACDIDIDEYEKIVRHTGDLPGIGGYKIGFYLMLREGLKHITLENDTLYNHCCASTDIPDAGRKMIDTLAPYSKITGIILTPLSGPATQETWIQAAKSRGKKVYIEPVIDSATFLKSGSGYIEDAAVADMINLGMNLGVDGFIFPDSELGNKLYDALHTKAHIIMRREGILDSNLDELTAYDVMPHGLPKIVSVARQHTSKPLIYDHQKAGMAAIGAGEFVSAIKSAGIDTVILFPQAGPEVAEKWIREALDNNLRVIVGGLMSHPQYLRSQGGYIADDSVVEIYSHAARLGITNFVVPGNKPEAIRMIRKRLESEGISPVFYAPGFVAQGGTIAEAAAEAGDKWHAIIGRGIYNAADMRQAALEYTGQL